MKWVTHNNWIFSPNIREIIREFQTRIPRSNTFIRTTQCEFPEGSLKVLPSPDIAYNSVRPTPSYSYHMLEMCEEMEIHATLLLLIDRRDLPAKVATNWQPVVRNFFSPTFFFIWKKNENRNEHTFISLINTSILSIRTWSWGKCFFQS